MRILLDECLPVKLKHRFSEANTEFQVSTVTDEKWTGLEDGKLLSKAQKSFDIFVTLDKSMSFQQKMSEFSVTLLVLDANSNRYKDLIDFIAPAVGVIKSVEMGKIYHISTKTK